MLSLLASLAPLATSRADVLIVDASGGGQYVQISSAVAAAANGDTLLVKNGTYAAFTIDGKSLSVAADTGAIVVISGSMGVKNLALAQTVVLSGLTSAHSGTSSTSSDPTFGSGLFVTACQGAVRAQACQFEGLFGTNSSCFSNTRVGRTGVYLGTSTNVAFVGCTLRGGDGGGHGGQCWCGTDGAAGGVGLFTQDSRAALYDCTATGGNGGRGAELGGKGGDGGLMQGSLGIFASHSFFQGGTVAPPTPARATRAASACSDKAATAARVCARTDRRPGRSSSAGRSSVAPVECRSTVRPDPPARTKPGRTCSRCRVRRASSSAPRSCARASPARSRSMGKRETRSTCGCRGRRASASSRC
jgi:hypothetical protein